jgi:hypothetical protein
MKRLMAMVLMLAATTAAACAQAPAAGDPHHPPQTAAPAQPAPPAPGQPGMGGQQGMMGDMPMMSMMHDMMRDMPMMNMMRMMRMMGMMGPGTAGAMATIDRVEGRIAFLRAELKITEAQTSAWNGFAEALRTNAQKLGQVRASMMPQPGSAQQQAPTLAERLDLQERWLAARLEGTRAIKSAFTTLYATLSDEQKKTAGELLAPHMGMTGMMGMMRGQMQPGPMQPGQTPQPRQ